MKIILSVLILFLAGCASDNNQQQGPIYSGTFTEGFESSGFKPCGQEKVYWLNGAQGGENSEMNVIRDVAKEIRKVTGNPYPTIYVEFIGGIDTREPVGFEEEYDGILVMEKLIDYSKVIPHTCVTDKN